MESELSTLHGSLTSGSVKSNSVKIVASECETYQSTDSASLWGKKGRLDVSDT